MHRNIKHLAWLTVLVLFLFACTLGSGTPDAFATLDPLYTQAAQTLEAMTRQGTVAAGSPLTSPTTTLSWVSTTPYQSPIPITLCNAAAFIKDVTIPDGSVYAPDREITKTWRLKNVGTCTWSTSYELVFVSGDRMDGTTSVTLSESVAPGEWIDVSTQLTTPSKSGHYRGYWKLRTSSGVLFGIGAQADIAFWVDLYVTGPEYIAYDFAARACDATWRYNNGSLPCPGVEGDDRGYVLKLSSPRMENGTIEDQLGLLTVPKHTANGIIRGRYPAIEVHKGDHFLANINCQYKATTCDVLFRLEYRIGNGPIRTLKEWHEVYEGKYYPVDLDLSSLAGEDVKFYLVVSANDSKGKDYALWLAPRILRQGNPPPTSTASKTPAPSATSTPTYTPTPSITPTFTDTPTATPTDTSTATFTPTP